MSDTKAQSEKIYRAFPPRTIYLNDGVISSEPSDGAERHDVPAQIVCESHDAEGRRVTRFMAECRAIGDSLSDAKQIATTLNAHEAMREALQARKSYDNRQFPPPFGHDCQWCAACYAKMLNLAEAALRLAEGK